MQSLYRIPPWLMLSLGLLTHNADAQDTLRPTTLPRQRFRNGEEMMRVFEPVSAASRCSIVKLNVNGETVALGTVMDTNGLTLTKASELKPGKLTCWLATEKELGAEVLATDEEQDLALVRVQAPGLCPIQWATEDISVGQWAITPGIAATPHAVGIISALPRRIRPQRALIGVQFELGSSTPKVGELMPGLGAEKAGLKPGDLIVGLNDVTVTSREQIIETLREFRAGQTVKVRVQRAGQELEKEVEMRVPRPEQLTGGANARLGRRMDGELSQRADGFEQAIEHDTVLRPWLCGGPLVGLDGRAIGLNIARAGRVTSFALPAGLVRRLFEKLKAESAVTRTNV